MNSPFKENFQYSGILTKKPEPLTCAFCGKTLHFRQLKLGENTFFFPPDKCSCDGAKKFWMEKEKLILHQKIELELAKREELCKSLFPLRFRNKTLEGYKINKKNELAFRQVSDYLKNFETYKKEGVGLILVGPVGTGKTHLAVSLGKEICKRQEKILFFNAVNMFKFIKSKFDENLSSSEPIDLLSEVTLLIIDDLGKEKQTEWTDEVLYQIINARYENLKPTIITSNLKWKEFISRLGDAVASRLLEMCKVVTFLGDDNRIKGEDNGLS